MDVFASIYITTLWCGRLVIINFACTDNFNCDGHIACLITCSMFRGHFRLKLAKTLPESKRWLIPI